MYSYVGLTELINYASKENQPNNKINACKYNKLIIKIIYLLISLTAIILFILVFLTKTPNLLSLDFKHLLLYAYNFAIIPGAPNNYTKLNQEILNKFSFP